ncbi:MAG: MBL fold metallo-hydrolase [Deltaproteobacteria bacterium]|nr:MBL fold metallo-hydrolase [Deltaproteobacteria bacterium]
MIEELGDAVYCVELINEKMKFATSGYLILAEKKIFIETGASPSNGMILEAFDELGVKPSELDFVIVTHIHLDHSGGAGLLISQCENAVLVCHRRAIAHLCDPAKLISSAETVYREAFKSYFDPILPIKKERIIVKGEGEELQIGPNRKLTFFDSPGHALHHFVVYDQKSRGVFSGDAGGMFYAALFKQYGVALCLPATTPTQFDPEAMKSTLEKIMALEPLKIFYTHFGMTDQAMILLRHTLDWVDLFGVEALSFYRQHRSLEKTTLFLEERIFGWLYSQGVPEDFITKEVLSFDIEVNAMGVVSLCARLDKYKS